MLRLEKTADGFKGVFVSISETPGAFAVTLDAQGRVRTKEPLERGGGTIRGPRTSAAPGAPSTQDARAVRGAAAQDRGDVGVAPPVRRNDRRNRPDYVFRPGEWNTLESILDTNILRSWLNDGPEAGVASGRVDDQIARLGRMGCTPAEPPQCDTARLKPRIWRAVSVSEDQVGAAFRLQRLNDFYDAWSATAADVNRDGVLDVVAGPHYFLGPDYRVSREIYVSRIYNPGAEYPAAAMNIAHDYTGDRFPDLVISEGTLSKQCGGDVPPPNTAICLHTYPRPPTLVSKRMVSVASNSSAPTPSPPSGSGPVAAHRSLPGRSSLLDVGASVVVRAPFSLASRCLPPPHPPLFPYPSLPRDHHRGRRRRRDYRRHCRQTPVSHLDSYTDPDPHGDAVLYVFAPSATSARLGARRSSPSWSTTNPA